ncbi:MAG TPA: amylo-alpha-1,6-glucosidase [Anaeromyxobacter sp.]|nr:amylo-alpha-1,6-glucosidase [Anaeromyxobacter sp.]
MAETPLRTGWRPADGPDALLEREWLVANGLGGYASGTVAGVCTRRYHGLLVAALPGLGRTVMLSHLADQIRIRGGPPVRLWGEEKRAGLELHGTEHLREFRLEAGLPVWVFAAAGTVVEKRLLVVHEQNTVLVSYRLLSGDGPVRLTLRPGVHFRPHDAPVSGPPLLYVLEVKNGRFQIRAQDEPRFPPLRLWVGGGRPAFTVEEQRLAEVVYRAEGSRGYDQQGELHSPGRFRVDLGPDPVHFLATTEPWEVALAMGPDEAARVERERRAALLDRAPRAAQSGPAAELVLAADAFLVVPAGRVEDAVHARAEGHEPRTVIAGYHWFTDWGRDTMISLEGLTLCTGRAEDAQSILRVFARHVRDGLIPNLFPEATAEGLYHTADATLWMFHALDRYVRRTGDRRTLRDLLPVMREVVRCHREGTRFGIRVDPHDGLLTQGEPGFALTWMDAKCDGWVVTPRRGKAVEVNALWYNALSNLMSWLSEEGESIEAATLRDEAERARDSFNRRFWYPEGGYLYDVVEGDDGKNDAACRPNQLLAISLPHPVLDPARWAQVLEVVRTRLATPMGLRSLSPDHPEYKRNYHGDLRTRDAAYHQGTVWSWLIGPYRDAWARVHHEAGRDLLEGLLAHLSQACIGQVSEVFDAEPPYAPRGCVAQAWGVAELLRAMLATED